MLSDALFLTLGTSRSAQAEAKSLMVQHKVTVSASPLFIHSDTVISNYTVQTLVLRLTIFFEGKAELLGI